ncbi:hypothetical protein BLA60_04710 [Actinophytocola xinjiangensis]|uniref:Carrier domain-containing protein n=1 Tax=Actinophytocola xinjiangensis TaxID=485602 RepID=A0A7Z1B187_9PSEU|nr:MupA/Atu3671 family FMN-dependent luciferase-like monooxygenase [Actinophytocola xinjiangensis]OLF14425.1 hypothetical protein BLA60_04710 [Actinophytocola xinjiangensis]
MTAEPEPNATARLEHLRHRLGGRRPVVSEQDTTVAGDQLWPLSFPQRQIWILEQLSPGSAAYHLPLVARITGAVDPAALRAALLAVLNRQDALRAGVVSDGSAVRQRFLAVAEVELPVLDTDGEDDLWRRAEEFVRTPFDLDGGPLWRATMLRLGPEHHVLMVCFHHLVIDGWSIGLFWNDLCAAYRAGPPTAGPATSYADFVTWQRERLVGDRLERELRYWADRLDGAPPLLSLPTDNARRPTARPRGGVARVDLPAEVVTGLHALARAEGASLYMVLLAVYATLLHRRTGEDDVLVGTPVANRTRPEHEPVIGLFTNTVVMRTRPRGRTVFRRFLRVVRDGVLDDLAHQELPFELLVRRVRPDRDLSYAPIFQVMFALHNLRDSGTAPAGTEVEFLDVAVGASRYDLDLSLVERGGRVTGRLEYNAELFDPSTAEGLARDFQELARSVVDDPDRSLTSLPLGTVEDRATALRAARGPVGEPNPALVHEQIAERARSTPDAVALDCLGEELTYRELDDHANQLAHHLRGLGAGPETVVAVNLERSTGLVVALLGVLRAGAAYLPVDPDHPADRIAHLLRDASVPIVVTSARLGERLPPVDAVLVRLDTDAAAISAHRADAPRTGVTAGNLAYVLHTSGSTGRPKGVLVEHGNVRNLLHALDEVVPDRGRRRWLAVTSVSFDISVLELLWTLARGYRVRVRARDGGDTGAAAEPGRDTLDFSLFYFGAEAGADGYRLLTDGARLADEHGFGAVWTPERHFNEFGGNFPNPAVTGAALATMTSRLEIRAGSVVLPLHDPLRVAEQWSVVDNLSGGRVGVSFASGWHPTDFALAPHDYQDRRRVMRERIEQVRLLWRGGTLSRRSGTGETVEVTSHPRPVRAELPVWLTAGGTRATFALAGELGVNLLTHLLGQDLDDLRVNIATYRDARAAAGYDPATGRVSVMLHTYVGDDLEQIRELLREPFSRYLRTSFGLMSNLATALGHSPTESDVDFLLAQAFDRYFEDSGLIGTPDMCVRRAERLFRLGVDEVACLVDLGVDHDTAMAGLRRLTSVVGDTRERLRRVAEADLPALLAEDGISHLQLTPSLLRSVLDDPAGDEALRGVEVLLVGGEEFPASLAAELAKRTSAQVLNLYGPTETTVWSMAHRVDPTASVVPIGTALANTQVFVLDGAGEPAPRGVLGEIFIGGLGVSRGYLGQPGLTAERFVPNPFGPPGSRMYRTGDRGYRAADDTVRFVGRADDQVKVRGFRVELREVEACLRTCPGVRDAAVTVVAEGLCAYVVTDLDTPWDPRVPREHVATALPRHMVPGVVVRVEALPRTANGKLDRARLTGLPASSTTPADVPDDPGSPTERVLVEIWREVFDRRHIGVSDDFFALGGHSLLGLRAIAAVRRRLGVPVPLRSLFEARTITALAQVIDRGTFAAPRPADPDRLHRDARLAPEIRPAGTGPWTPPATVLVTGATGFLGRVLVAELLAHRDLTVHCLVLAEDDTSGQRSVEEALRAAGLWREEWRRRIVAVAGDLSRPRFGLDPRRFADLADEVDTVYHAGALVHLLYPYDVLRGPNVDGTVEALRLACTGRPKTFHHVSTLEVFPDDVPHREDVTPGEDCRAHGAYAQSKWVAERLVAQAADRGLPVCVLRPGNVAGHRRTGYWNTLDPMYTLIRGCLRIGAAPDLDLVVNLTPVDYAASAIARLSFDEGSVGQAFHLFNPNPATPWAEVVDVLRGAGHDLDLLPYRQWRDRYPGRGPGSDELSDMVALSAEFDGLGDVAANGRSRLKDLEIDCSATVRALAGTGIDCGPVDAALIGTYLGHWAGENSGALHAGH